LRFAGPTNPFVKQDLKSSAALPGGIGLSANAGTCTVAAYFGTGTSAYQPVGASWVSGVAGVVAGAGADTGLSKMNVSVTIFRGLAGAAGVFPSSIKVKLCTGLELMPSTLTPDRVYSQPALAFDPRTLEAYYAAVVGMRDAYPSSYNGFGEILSTIAGVAKSVWPAVRGIGNMLVGGGDAPPPVPPPPPPTPARLEYRAPSEPLRPAMKPPRAPSAARSSSYRVTAQKKKKPAVRRR